MYYNFYLKINKITNLNFVCRNIYHLFIMFIIKLFLCSNISTCLFLKILFVLKYKCVPVFKN